MDRTAWIVVTLCVVGLVVWEIYSFKQIQPRPAIRSTPAATSTSPITGPSPAALLSPTTTPAALGQPSATPGPSAAAFAEVTDTIRNSDLELHLTNRGGGIAE